MISKCKIDQQSVKFSVNRKNQPSRKQPEHAKSGQMMNWHSDVVE